MLPESLRPVGDAQTTYSLESFLVLTVGTFLVHNVCWLLLNLPYLVLEDRGWFEQYRLQPTRRVPSSERWATLRMLARAHVTQMLPLQVLTYPLLVWCRVSPWAGDRPSAKLALAQFVVFNVLEDTLFYWVHRLLHREWFFRRVHYRHHEFDVPYSLANEVAHPAEFLFNFLLPLVSGPLLLGLLHAPVHIGVFWVWMVFREARGVDAHSGYDLPFHPLRLLRLVGYGGPRAHDTHHTHRGLKTNFGGYFFWDWICGTSFEQVMAKRATSDTRGAAGKRVD